VVPKNGPSKPVTIPTASGAVGNKGKGQIHESAIVERLPLPTDTQRAEVVVPAVGSLDDPAARSPSDAADERLFTPPTNVRGDSSLSRFALGIGVVVSFVEAQVFGPTRASRSVDEDCVQRRPHHPLVVDVCTGQRHRQRDAAPIGQNVALAAELRAIGRVGASEFPPFGALTMALSREAQSQSIPRSWW